MFFNIFFDNFYKHLFKSNWQHACKQDLRCSLKITLQGVPWWSSSKVLVHLPPWPGFISWSGNQKELHNKYVNIFSLQQFKSIHMPKKWKWNPPLLPPPRVKTLLRGISIGAKTIIKEQETLTCIFIETWLTKPWMEKIKATKLSKELTGFYCLFVLQYWTYFSRTDYFFDLKVLNRQFNYVSIKLIPHLNRCLKW